MGWVNQIFRRSKHTIKIKENTSDKTWNKKMEKTKNCETNRIMRTTRGSADISVRKKFRYAVYAIIS